MCYHSTLSAQWIKDNPLISIALYWIKGGRCGPTQVVRIPVVMAEIFAAEVGEGNAGPSAPLLSAPLSDWLFGWIMKSQVSNKMRPGIQTGSLTP